MLKGQVLLQQNANNKEHWALTITQLGVSNKNMIKLSNNDRMKQLFPPCFKKIYRLFQYSFAWWTLPPSNKSQASGQKLYRAALSAALKTCQIVLEVLVLSFFALSIQPHWHSAEQRKIIFSYLVLESDSYLVLEAGFKRLDREVKKKKEKDKMWSCSFNTSLLGSKR